MYGAPPCDVIVSEMKKTAIKYMSMARQYLEHYSIEGYETVLLSLVTLMKFFEDLNPIFDQSVINVAI